jgi:hypothetical protein
LQALLSNPVFGRLISAQDEVGDADSKQQPWFLATEVTKVVYPEPHDAQTPRLYGWLAPMASS